MFPTSRAAVKMYSMVQCNVKEHRMTFKLDNRRPFPRCPENASGPGPAWPMLSECYDRTLSHHTASVRHSKKTLRGVLTNIS